MDARGRGEWIFTDNVRVAISVYINQTMHAVQSLSHIINSTVLYGLMKTMHAVWVKNVH